jgi:hypothetical protein
VVSNLIFLRLSFFFILNYVQEINNQIKRKELLQFAISNAHLQNVINYLDEYCKSLNSNYNLYHRFGYEAYISLCFNYHKAVDFLVPDKILIEKCEDRIRDYILNKINPYFCSLIKIDNYCEIITILNDLNSKYMQINKSEIHSIKIDRKRYKNKICKYCFTVKYNQLFENVIEILFCKHSIEGNYDYTIGNYYIHNNDLYACRYYADETQITNDGRLIVKNINNIRFLKMALISEFSELVRKEKYNIYTS